jgi:O-acetyl-ADP-ribose deacetylase (regulator of RNase III)
MGGGGVDGAIHRAGGPVILEECRAIRAERGNLPTGEAVITSGGRLPARYVIHTVGPVWLDGAHGEEDLLARAYRSCLDLAARRHLTSIAFPSISTGIYGFPVERAAPIALAAVLRHLHEVPRPGEVRLVLYSAHDLNIYESAAASARMHDDHHNPLLHTR